MSRLSRLMRCTALLAAAVLGSTVSGRARAEDAVLLASTVPGYAPGMVISSADRLSLPDGATATLLFQSGEMLRLRGPFEGTLGQQQERAGTTSAGTIADMFRLHGVDATVIGGTRSTGTAKAEAVMEEVQVDPQRSGTYCVEPATSVWIGRPAGEQGVYTLRRMGRTRTLGWPEGTDRIEWPADVPVEDGSQFEIVANGAARATVSFRELPVGSGPAHVAKALLLGCHDQFDDQLRRLRQAASVPDVWMTTDRGRRPTYRQGEPISLTVVADADGYLYCVAIRDDGGATPIFPSGAVDGAQLRGSTPLSIPGHRQPVGLVAFPGLAQVRCWLADRDISPELPHALVGVATARLPDQLSSDLGSLFSRINGTRIASDAVMVMTE